VKSVDEVMTILVRGNMVRSTAATDGNQRSSRSHAIFIVEVMVTDTTAGLTRSSELYLVDLAGSESVGVMPCSVLWVCAVHCCHREAALLDSDVKPCW
jgi:hypothetical protein